MEINFRSNKSLHFNIFDEFSSRQNHIKNFGYPIRKKKKNTSNIRERVVHSVFIYSQDQKYRMNN